MNTRRNTAKMERTQLRMDAGSMAEHYPEVANITISMKYHQKGIRSLVRTFTFSSGSYAFFKLDCLSKDCVDGGFDLTHIITEMIRYRREEAKGELGCEGHDDPSSCESDIVYEVAIRYA